MFLTTRVLKLSVLNTTLKLLIVEAPIALLAAALLMSLSCGKRKPPLPPRERVPQRAELSGFQRGSNVVLSWKMPAQNAGKGSVLNIDRVDIYRLAEPVTSPLTMSEEEFASRSILIATVPVADADFAKTITFRDRLEFAGQTVRLRYSVRFANVSGQKAAFSNFVAVEPAARISSAPASLFAQVSQEAIRLEWMPPTENVDRTTPVNILGYYIYRSSSEREPARLLNSSPETDNTFEDEFFEFGKQYFYFVRAVSAGPDAAPIESDESNIVSVKTVDTFAPSPPAAITLAAGPKMISIFFAVNPEKDVAGYKIYRSTDRNLSPSEWTLLTPDVIKTNTFQDTRVEPGTTYYYYLTATDINGNVSDPSEIVSETASE